MVDDTTRNGTWTTQLAVISWIIAATGCTNPFQTLADQLDESLTTDDHVGADEDIPTALFTKDAGASQAQSSPQTVCNTPKQAALTAVPVLAPISGGTLAMSLSGPLGTVIAADSQRDVLWLSDAAPPYAFIAQIDLPAHSEPGRVVVGPDPLAFVALRASGNVATIDVSSHAIVETRHVCAETRGIAYDFSAKLLHVVCGEGDLVTLPMAGMTPLVRTPIARDLRDVVIVGADLWVSEFRTPRIWQVPPSRVPLLLTTVVGDDNDVAAHVAWRMAPAANGGVVMAHQLEKLGEIAIPPESIPGGYGASPANPAGLVQGTVTTVGPTGTVNGGQQLDALSMPVDIAVSPDSSLFAVVDPSRDAVRIYPLTLLGGAKPLFSAVAMNAVAAAFTPRGDLVVQTTLPSLVIFVHTSENQWQMAPPRALPGAELDNVGHAVFHRATSAGVACAHCHPEGHEDGHIWSFSEEGARRTQSLTGGVLATAPLHWSGHFCSLDGVMSEVFEHRMAGEPLGASDVASLGTWLNGLLAPAPQSALDPVAVANGKALFESAEVGCATCHSGPRFTDNENHDVSTGASLQTPSLLGVSARLPVMHDGCAQTLHQRFATDCGGGDSHGKTSQLSAEQIGALVAYLASL